MRDFGTGKVITLKIGRPACAEKLEIHRNTAAYWRDFGIKVNGENIRLKMNKRPFKWYSKGKWLIEFFLKTNANVEME